MKVKRCKICGGEYDADLKTARDYHEKQCLIDLKKRLDDPLGLKRFA